MYRYDSSARTWIQLNKVGMHMDLFCKGEAEQVVLVLKIYSKSVQSFVKNL